VIFQRDVGIGINRESAYPEETRLFLEWMMSKEAVDLTPQEAAQHLQSGLGEWYEPAQSCK